MASVHCQCAVSWQILCEFVAVVNVRILSDTIPIMQKQPDNSHLPPDTIQGMQKQPDDTYETDA